MCRGTCRSKLKRQSDWLRVLSIEVQIGEGTTFGSSGIAQVHGYKVYYLDPLFIIIQACSRNVYFSRTLGFKSEIVIEDAYLVSDFFAWLFNIIHRNHPRPFFLPLPSNYELLNFLGGAMSMGHPIDWAVGVRCNRAINLENGLKSPLSL